MLYGVYDMKNYEQCIGVFKTSREVAEFFNTTAATIRGEICRSNLRECRYLIVKVEEKSKDE